MGSFNKSGKNAFEKKFVSNNTNLILASTQPFGERSWKNLAEFGRSIGNGEKAYGSVLSQLPTGSTGTLRPLIADSFRNGQIGRDGVSLGRQKQPYMSAMMLGGKFANSTADADANWRASAPSNKVAEEFDPLQSFGACSLPSWRQRTRSDIPNMEPSPPRGKYLNEVYQCGAQEEHASSTCEVYSLNEKKEYKNLFDIDTGFSHKRKRRYFPQGQPSRNVKTNWNHPKGFAQRGNQQNIMQGQYPKKSDLSGYQDNLKNANVNRLENGFEQRGRKQNCEKSLSKVGFERHGHEAAVNQSWYDIAEIVQGTRIEKICQKMRIICGLLLNGNDYRALQVFSTTMNIKISNMKRYMYERDQSENLFNDIMSYLQRYQSAM